MGLSGMGLWYGGSELLVLGCYFRSAAGEISCELQDVQLHQYSLCNKVRNCSIIRKIAGQANAGTLQRAQQH